MNRCLDRERGRERERERERESQSKDIVRARYVPYLYMDPLSGLRFLKPSASSADQGALGSPAAQSPGSGSVGFRSSAPLNNPQAS